MRRLLPLLLAGLVLAGCGTTGRDEPHTVTVFAAASLQEAFTTLAKQYDDAHPGVHVELSFGPSSGLAEQINQGAPADVFASASPTNMDQVVEAGNAKDPVTFARNDLEIAVPPANPAHVTALDDLANHDVKVAVCQPKVPCGMVAREVFAKAHLAVTPVSEELDVKSVLTRVSLGEVDAGMVYATDVRAAGDKVRGIVIPPALNASTTYPIAALAHSGNRSQARGFVDYVLSAAGLEVLTDDGFQRP